MEEKSCPRCIPFSPELVALYRKLQRTEDPDERGELLLQLAHQFADEYDASDELFSEAFHNVMDTYHQQYLAFNQAGLRLGRVLLHVLEEHTEEVTSSKVAEVTETDHSVN